MRHPPTSTLFPYTTLFRSRAGRELLYRRHARVRAGGPTMKEREDNRARWRWLVVLARQAGVVAVVVLAFVFGVKRSEEHTSELQSQFHLVCRLLLEKKKNR